MSPEELIRLCPQDQFVWNGLMNLRIPLLLIVAANDIYNLCNPADALHPILQVINFGIVHFIHKLLNICHL
ncbi:hypothetical protein D1872_322050 [compost metagenome]